LYKVSEHGNSFDITIINFLDGLNIEY